MDDPDVEVVDEHEDGGSGVGSADADMEEAAAMVEGTLPSLSIRSCRTRGWLVMARGCGEALGSGSR